MRSRRLNIGGLKVRVSAFHWNARAYRQSGGKVRIRASRRKIRRHGARVELACFYFERSLISGESVLSRIVQPVTAISNGKRTIARHFVVNATPGIWPSGVVTVASIRINGSCETVVVQAGSVDPNFDAESAARSLINVC